MGKTKSAQVKKEVKKPPTEEEQLTQVINQLITNTVLQHEGFKQGTVDIIKGLGQRLAQELMTRRALEKKIAELEKKK